MRYQRALRQIGWVFACFWVMSLSHAAPTTDAGNEAFDDFPLPDEVRHPDWFSDSFLDLREDLAEAQREGKKGIAIYFGQKYCAYCQLQMDVNWGKEQDIVDYTRRYFNVIQVDIWGSRELTDVQGNTLTESAFAEQQKTNFTPALIFYVDDGREALKLVGYYPPYKFRAALHYVVGDHYKAESLRDYLERADPPPKFDLADLNAQPFFENPPYMLDRRRFPGTRPLAVFFEQHDCHACDILHSGALLDERVQRQIAGFDTVQLDMWSKTPVLTPDGQRLTAVEWAKQLGLFFAPTVVFFDEHGKEVMRIDSVARLYRLSGVLDYVTSKGYEKAPTFLRWRDIAGRSERAPHATP